MIIPRWSWLLAVAGASAGTGAMVTRQLTRRQLQPLHTQVTALETFGQTHLHLAPPAPVSADLASAYPTLTTLESKLRHILAQMGGQMEQLNLRHQQEQKQQTLFNALSFRIRQTPQTQVLFQTAVTGAQQILGCDRVVIYRFNRDWSGTVVAESVSPGFVTLLQEWIDDSCFTQDTDPYAKAYQEGRIRAINDIYTEPNLSPCYLQMLEQYQVRANLVVPIRDNHQLTGFLIAQTCAKPRQWQPEDLSFLSHLATELEYKLDYLNYIQAQEAAAQRSWLFNEIAFRARQFLNLDDIFQTTVQGTREILKADRVLIYRFNPTWVGTMVAESVGPEFVQVLDENIDDPCFRGRYVELYREGRVRAINDIYH
jgi:methyl-accepting chemotaxis protein PixJ